MTHRLASVVVLLLLALVGRRTHDPASGPAPVPEAARASLDVLGGRVQAVADSLGDVGMRLDSVIARMDRP